MISRCPHRTPTFAPSSTRAWTVHATWWSSWVLSRSGGVGRRSSTRFRSLYSRPRRAREPSTKRNRTPQACTPAQAGRWHSSRLCFPLADLVVTVGLRNGEILGPAGKKGFVNFDVPHRQATADDVIAGEDELRRGLTRLADLPAWGTDLIEEQRRRWESYVNSHEWMPGQVFEALDAIELPHALVLDTGTFCTIGEHGWHARPGREFLGSSNGRNLGLGVPHALGAACAKPGLPIFCALGDGGIRYYLGEVAYHRGSGAARVLHPDGRWPVRQHRRQCGG